MSHENKIVDPDKYFKVDPTTRKVTDEMAANTVVMQYDHNSERLTFLVPRFIENHDMLECNKAEVHYSITDSITKERTTGIYEIDDLKSQYSGESENVICTWLLSQNVTRIVGSLKFVLRFSCVKEDGTIEYAWSTAVCDALNIESGIYNSEAVIELYPDVLEQWKSEVYNQLKDGAVEFITIDPALSMETNEQIEFDSFIEPKVYAFKSNDGFEDTTKTRLLFVDRTIENILTISGESRKVTIAQHIFDPGNNELRRRFGECNYSADDYTGTILPEDISWGEWTTIGGSGNTENVDIPTKLSDLEDDSQEKPIINALWAMNSDYAACDNYGNEFPTTYATKEELGDIETALDSIIAIQESLIGGDSV